MSEHDTSGENLSEIWQATEGAPVDPSRFSAELRNRRRLTLLVVVGEAVLTVALVWLTWRMGHDGLANENAVFLIGLWLFWTVATIFAWWNRRGAWETASASTEVFLRKSLDRADRKIRMVWFTLGLLAAELAFVAWLIMMGAADGMLRMAATAAIAILYLIWCRWYYKRAVAERTYYGDLLRNAGDE